MMRTCRLLLLLAALAALAVHPARATSYVMMADGDLAAQATAVVDAVVVSVEPAPVSGRPATDYTVEIERLLAGSAPGTTLIVRVPGGIGADGRGFRVYGAPQFAPGERAILFLVGRKDGTFALLHLGLGAFHRVAAAGAPPLAVRDLSEATEVVLDGEPDPQRHLARDYDAFAEWLADRGAGIERPRDYFVADAPGGRAALHGKFTLFEIGGRHLRWFDFDSGGAVDWFAHSRGQAGLPGGGFDEFQQALQAWNADPQTPIQLRYRGQTSASGGLDRFDAVNTLLQGDPGNEIGGAFRCGEGGTLAIGGPWFDRGVVGQFRGQTYIRIQGGDVVMNDGIECMARETSCYAPQIAAIYGHEIGHALGIGHSCGDSHSPSCSSDPDLNDALMRAHSHGGCRGARLGVDDLRAGRRLYELAGPPAPRGPAAPTALTGSLDVAVVSLDWEDRSTDELGFRIYRSTGGGPLVEIAEAGPEVTRYLDYDVSPATTYAYRVASFNARGESAKTAPVTVTVPPAVPVSVALSTAPAVEARVGEPVEFVAQFSGPARIATWSFGAGEVGFNDTPCAGGAFCRSHVFDTPGPRTVEVTVTGPFGQVAHDTLQVQVADGSFEADTAASFLQWTIFGRRGDTGTFESNVWLHNAGSQPARVELSYMPRGLDAPPAPRTLTMAPAESLFLPNVLEKVFGVSAGQGSLALRVEQARVEGAPGPRVFAISRSFVELDNRAEGSFGLFVPEQGEAAWTPDAKVVTGILEGDGFISTLLGVNLDDRPGRVEIDLFDRHGDPVGDPAALVLGPGVMRFRQTQELFPEVADREGPFTAHFSSNGIRFLASSTLLETGSEDQIFLAAREPVAADELIVPRVVRSPGQFGVFLTTSLAVLNQGQAPLDATFQLLLRGQANSAPLEATRTVPAGGLLFLEDVIDELYGLETATGALRVLWDGGAATAPRVVAMTSSEAARGGRFGMAVESLSPAAAIAGTGVAFGTEQSDLFRSQYGAVNLENGRTDVRLTLRDANGVEMARTDLVLRSRQHLELNLVSLFGPVAETGSNWSVTTEVVRGGPVVTYIANINASGDVFFAPGRPSDTLAPVGE